MVQRCLYFLLSVAVLLPLTPRATYASSSILRVQRAVRVLNGITQVPDKAIPDKLLRKAYAVAVIPNLLKVGFIFGGHYGKGLISVKRTDGSWSNPTFIRLTGASVGFQMGVASSDVVLVFVTRRGVDSIVNGKFTLGMDATAAAGPLGRHASAATDGKLHAEIYAYARSRGLFAGVALDGGVISIDYGANAAVYGTGITPRRIFEGGVRRVPDAVKHFRHVLEKYTSR